jgi:hypothetical protein
MQQLAICENSEGMPDHKKNIYLFLVTHFPQEDVVSNNCVLLLYFKLFLSCCKCTREGISVILRLLSNLKEQESCQSYELFPKLGKMCLWLLQQK